MDCKNCELKQRQYFCENCVKSLLLEYRHQTHQNSLVRDETVSKAINLLPTIAVVRERRANTASTKRRLEEAVEGLAKLRRDNDLKRERLQALRTSLATRRRTLAAARLLPALSNTPVTDLMRNLREIHYELIHARGGLVQELVEVFNITEIRGRGRNRSEWTIGGLVLPVSGDMKRYPPDHINAVLSYTIHFILLMTFYLGIKLPFSITWMRPVTENGTSGYEESKLGFGQPWIGADSGGESGNWAKFTNKHPLFVSSAQSPSYPPFADSHPSFTTGLTMLLYNAAYLAFTQGVDVPLGSAGEILGILSSVCLGSSFSAPLGGVSLRPETIALGQRSHAASTSAYPAASLAPPTPSSFGMDFVQLLQVMSGPRAPLTKGKRTRRGFDRVVEEDEDGWDIVDDAADEDMI